MTENVAGCIQGICKEVLDKTEWAAIVTWDGDAPHLVATWGDYIRRIGIVKGNTLVIPAGRYNKTEENLKRNKSVKILIASAQVRKSSGQSGQGCILYGEGEIQTDGELAQRAKEKFNWARGALVITVRKTSSLL